MKRGRAFAPRGAAIALVVVWVLALASGPAHAAVTCGKVLKHDTTLHANLTGCTGDGLIIGANGIHIELGGKAISGTGNGVGIRLDGHHDVFIDGENHGQEHTPAPVYGFALGISLDNTDYSEVRNVNADQNGVGILLQNGSDHNQIKNDNARQSSVGAGISLVDSDFNKVKGSTVTDNALSGIFLSNSNGNTLKNISAGTDGGNAGVELSNSDDNVLVSVSSESNAAGEGILIDGNRNSITGGSADINNLNGVHVLPGSKKTLIDGVQAGFNGENGIRVEANDAGTVISNNNASVNALYGINANAGVTDGGGNTASGNGNIAQCLNVACT